jgi:DNA-binding NarL/FixJ family response regulator
MAGTGAETYTDSEVDTMGEGRDIVDVWLVEDNTTYRRSIARLIEQSGGMTCSLAVVTCEEALAALETRPPPAIVLMDISLPGINGIEGTRRLRTRSPDTRVIMLTVHEESDKVFEAICAGASGYLLKPADAAGIVRAIREVQDGAAPINAFIARKMLDMFSRLSPPESDEDYGLSGREREILQLMTADLTLGQIAERLFVSRHTIDTHSRNIYAKLHVHTRIGAVTKALKEGLIR